MTVYEQVILLIFLASPAPQSFHSFIQSRLAPSVSIYQWYIAEIWDVSLAH